MTTEKFTTYYGQYICHKCKEMVTSCRLWHATKDLTWMCDKKHMSRVNMLPKSKKDYN